MIDVLYNEEWRPIRYKDIDEVYFISNNGRVYNAESGKLMALFHDEKGYVITSLMCSEGRNKTVKVHRLVATAFLSNPDNLPHVNHKDGRKRNNYYENLEWSTISDNVKHAYKTGLMKPKRGIDNGTNKYSEEIIHYICQRLKDGYKGRQIIKEVYTKFDIKITRYLVSDIKRKKNWTHVSDKYFENKL